MARRQFYALGWHQVGIGVMRWRVRHVLVYGTDHLFIGGRPGHAEHFRVQLADGIGIGPFAHTAGHDHPTVLAQGLANGIQRLLFGAVDKTAGIDHHELCIFVGRYNVVAIQFELGQDTLGVNQGLGAAQADEANGFLVGVAHAVSCGGLACGGITAPAVGGVCACGRRCSWAR